MNQKEVNQAASVLRKAQGHAGKRGSRRHDDAHEDNVHRLRALEGICGRCLNLSAEHFQQHGKEVVRLRCQRQLSPLELYRKTALGTQAQCTKFETT